MNWFYMVLLEYRLYSESFFLLSCVNYLPIFYDRVVQKAAQVHTS